MPAIEHQQASGGAIIRSLLSSLQILTTEVRELNKRIAWIREAPRPAPAHAEPPQGRPHSDRVRMVRKALGISQQKMAEKLNVTQTTVSMIERGQLSMSTEIQASFARIERHVGLQ